MKNETMESLVNRFVAYKRNTGYVYGTQEHYLKHYLEHVREKFPDIAIPDKQSVSSYIDTLQGQAGGLYNAMAVLREFARYLIRLGYQDAYLIPPKQMPKLSPEPPYFLSEEEILAFFNARDRYFSEHTGPLGRGLVVPAEFRLLCCCGLRTKEARMLKTADVHLDDGYIDIEQSKGPKSRRVYISSELAGYLRGYDRKISGMFPGRTYFFPKSEEKPYSRQFIYYDFDLIWGIAFPEWEGKRPRVYDFRHHFAWATINRWAREGSDVNAMLPYLMRYMGHNSIKHTLYYFRFVPDFYRDYRKLSAELDSRIPEVRDE